MDDQYDDKLKKRVECLRELRQQSALGRKAHGGAHDVLGSKHIRADFNFAWPTAEIAVMGPEGAIKIISRKEITQAEDQLTIVKRLTAEYRERFATPYVTAKRGYIDDVIEPQETRPRLIRALEVTLEKRELTLPKKHGNIPL